MEKKRHFAGNKRSPISSDKRNEAKKKETFRKTPRTKKEFVMELSVFNEYL